MSWSDLADWWLSEIAGDPAYDAVVTPALLDILKPESGNTYVDLGCGEGRVAAAVMSRGSVVLGLELLERLAQDSEAPTVVGDVDRVPFQEDALDGAYAVLVLEHLVNHSALFSEAARIVRTGGKLAIVSNHPIWTAPGSTPIQDTDGESLWRPGSYFTDGSTEIEVAGGTVRFHHRSMSDLLNAAADAGWALEELVELPHHEFEGQSGIPRLLACRWRLLP